MNSDQNDVAIDGLIRFLEHVGHLKQIPRTGWLHRGVPADRVESVADHSFRVALLAWLAAAADPTLDRDRILKLALIHDLAESITGDLTPYDPAILTTEANEDARKQFLNGRHQPGSERSAEKRQAESIAFSSLIEELPAGLRTELAELWEELRQRRTPESQFVKQADRVETYLQSVEYQRLDPALPMESFRLEVEETVDISPFVELRAAIRARGGDRTVQASE